MSEAGTATGAPARRWPTEVGLVARMVLVLPLLAFMGVVVAIVGVAIGLLLVGLLVATFGMVSVLPLALVAEVLESVVQIPESVGVLCTLVWMVAVFVLAVHSGQRALRSWYGSAVGSVRSFLDTTESLLAETPTRPATDARLTATTAALAQQVDLPTPDLVVAETDTPEVLTVGFRPETTTLVVTDGLLDTLDDRELEAVVAHELAHVKNHDATLMTAASSVVTGARRIRHYAWWGGPANDGLELFAVVVSLVLIPVTLCARVLVATLSRARERAADRGAVAITGDSAGLASALGTLDAELVDPPETDLRHEEVVALSIVAPPREPIVAKQSWERRRPILWTVQKPVRRGIARLRRWVRRAFSTHPPTDVRVERLRSHSTGRGSPASREG